MVQSRVDAHHDRSVRGHQRGLARHAGRSVTGGKITQCQISKCPEAPMNRRETIKALAATALLPVLPAGFFPLVLPLPPHSPESIAVLMKSYLKKAAIADDLSLPEP